MNKNQNVCFILSKKKLLILWVEYKKKIDFQKNDNQIICFILG